MSLDFSKPPEMKIFPYDANDPAAFLDRAEESWSTDPVFNNLQWALSLRFCQEAGPYAAAIFEEAGNRWIGLQTVAKRPMILNGPDELSEGVVRAILDYFPASAGLTASKSIVAQLAPAWGKQIVDTVPMYLYELSALDPTVKFEGQLRQVGQNDRERLVQWIEKFAIAINERLIGRNYREEADKMIAGGQIWFLEINGQVVSMAGSTRSVGGVACVNYVYTPEESRGRGFASSNVGLLSEYLLRSHQKTCLYAEEGYPASNRVYQKLGYEIVSRVVEVDFKQDS
ncbi:hypothetical protein CEQ90_05460 [Lewinellaceae bacterium SD302]|nr:hypothetical protein CEQ90_05460 [Lewinellaceae bacterium SD302]